MSYIVIRSRGDREFRRSGITFAHDAWTVVPEPTEAQLAEPLLEHVEISSPQDSRLRGLPIVSIDGTPENDEDGVAGVIPRPLIVDQAAVDSFLANAGLVAVKEENLDGLKEDLQDLQEEKTAAETALGALKGDETAATALLEEKGRKVLLIADFDNLASEAARAAELRTQIEVGTTVAEPTIDDVNALATKFGLVTVEQSEYDRLLLAVSAPTESLSSLGALVDSILTASATSLERLPNPALTLLCQFKGINPIPEDGKAMVAALKPAS